MLPCIAAHLYSGVNKAANGSLDWGSSLRMNSRRLKTESCLVHRPGKVTISINHSSVHI